MIRLDLVYMTKEVETHHKNQTSEFQLFPVECRPLVDIHIWILHIAIINYRVRNICLVHSFKSTLSDTDLGEIKMR